MAGRLGAVSKSWALLLEPLRHIKNPRFSAVIFRRNAVQVKNPGGLWDESAGLYGRLGRGLSHVLEWKFPGGAKVKFGHLEHELSVRDWQGSQIPLLGFDELCHFSRSQFFYMLSRNRSMCGVKPYVRATCNPDADSWVADFISWWIDPDTGFPIPERGGVIRWFVRVGDTLIWGDTKEELQKHLPKAEDLPEGVDPPEAKSVTFIPAKLSDNKALMAADPGYLANLLALPTVERERLLGGNWKIRPSAGLFFRREWCEIVDAVPSGLHTVRYWDMAATAKTEHNDPDWTVGVKMARDDAGTYYVLHSVRLRADPGEVETTIKNTASADGRSVSIGIPQDPGAAGKAQAAYMIRQLDGYTCIAKPESGSKVTRFGPFSAQARAGNVKILRGPWNEDFLRSLEGFPEAAHDDDPDACSGAFEMFQDASTGIIEFYRRKAAQGKDKG